MIFVGIDWAEAHHDVCVLDEQGRVLAKGRVPDGAEGIGRLHAMVAEHAEDPPQVVVGIEIDRGLLVGALVTVGYRVYAINPFAVSRYRDRHATSGAKSDPGDAKVLAEAYGQVVGSLVLVIDHLTHQIGQLEHELEERFEGHPDAEILRSLPGLGPILGARVLAEFGDDPTRYEDARAMRVLCGKRPDHQGIGNRLVVLARVARNRRLADACYLWAFSALISSPGARRYYDARRGQGATHHQALRALSNRLVGVLHGCLRHRQLYREEVAWPDSLEAVA